MFSKRNIKHVLRVSIELWKHSRKFGRTRKSCGNTRLRLVFRQHFSFSHRLPLVLQKLDRNTVHVFYFLSIKRFLSTACWRNLKTKQSLVILDLCLKNTQAGKVPAFLDFQVDPVYSALDKFRFRDGLVCKVVLTVGIKLRF